MERKRYAGYDEARLPEDFGYGWGSLFYEDVEYKCDEREVGVREDGLDAWGAAVYVPQDSFVRRIGYNGNEGNWEFAEDEKMMWLTMVGAKVEFIHIEPDGCLEWCRCKAVEL